MARIVELAETKKVVTSDDLPFIISDVLEMPESCVFEIKDFMIVSNKGLKPAASVLVRYKKSQYQVTSSGDGGYDAFMKALHTLEDKLGFKLPKLLDYSLRIPPGGKTNALVETTILWEGGIKTRAVNSDQMVAAIEATSRAINIIAMRAEARNKE
jgi:(R)-citramalate synthase